MPHNILQVDETEFEIKETVGSQMIQANYLEANMAGVSESSLPKLQLVA
jgi:hypothetical protein